MQPLYSTLYLLYHASCTFTLAPSPCIHPTLTPRYSFYTLFLVPFSPCTLLPAPYVHPVYARFSEFWLFFHQFGFHSSFIMLWEKQSSRTRIGTHISKMSIPLLFLLRSVPKYSLLPKSVDNKNTFSKLKRKIKRNIRRNMTLFILF